MGTISKALGLLNHFSVEKPEIGLTEFQKLAKRDKATVYRHLVELEENGFLQQDVLTKSYRLGPAILRLANVRELTFPARDAVAPLIDTMSKELGELVHVSLLEGTDLASLYHADHHQHGLRVSLTDSPTFPLHATSSGISVLAFGDPELLEFVKSAEKQTFTEDTRTASDDIDALIENTQRRGYCNSDSTYEEGVCSYGVPVFDRNGDVQGAVAVAFPSLRGGAQNRDRIVEVLLRNAATVTEKLGGVVPENLKALWT